jgi:hypothetical protein
MANVFDVGCECVGGVFSGVCVIVVVVVFVLVAVTAFDSVIAVIECCC